ncbi:putative nucleoside-diphosphate-sugar epimerase [Oxalobacteraceae bacterium IMCC9480]|nr:putative nucleoside-diphosphate-sugar epimerase [Oxalobacteraceae bacterium IMCC9480]
MGAVGDGATEELAFATAAGAVFAAVRQADAGADCRGQDGFIGSAAELVAARSDGNLESHTIPNMNKSLTTKKIGLPRVLIIGCGDVGMRLLPLLRARFRVFAVTSQPGRIAELRAAGAIPIVANLDEPHSLARLSRLARHVVHLAPPQSEGTTDRRTRNLFAILPDAATVVYVSTSGVYGDCGGALIDETRPVNPVNARARRRVDAEQVLRRWARRAHGRLGILRVPGIYGADRLPLERLRKGTPALVAADDVYTNHIHADDLARIIATALFRLQPNRVVHTVDDSAMKMGEYFDAVADAFDMPRPPRLPRTELRELVSPMLLSFMSESRQLSNRRLKQELGVRLQYPTVADALRAIESAARD